MLKFRHLMTPRTVLRAMDRVTVRALFRNAARLRLIARRSIRKRKRKNSLPGNPPFTRTGKKGRNPLRRAIVFEVNRAAKRAIIGPRASVVGQVGELHEFGGTRGGLRFPARPFMGPALDKIRDDLPMAWRSTMV